MTGLAILLGDFNVGEENKVIADLKWYWRKVNVNGMVTPTWPAQNPQRAFSPIFTGRSQCW